MKRTFWGAATLCLLIPAWCAADENSPGYQVIKTIKVGGEGFWDYLTCDGAAHRLYISRGTRVQVLDLDKEEICGEIKNTPGVHGIALNPDKGRGYTSNGRDGTVTVFDVKNLDEIKRIEVGKDKGPDGILYDPSSKRVFTFNGRGKDCTAIDTEKDEVVGNLDLGGKPESAACDGKGMVYVNIEDKSEIVAIDAANLKEKARWSVSPGEEAVGLAIDPAHNRLYCSCHNGKMVVLDTESGKVLGTAPIGKGTDYACFDADKGLAFSSNGDGTLSIVKDDGAGGFKTVQNVKTQRGARTMALDPMSHKVYLVTAKFKPAPEGANQQGQRRRPEMEPDSFVVLVVGPKE